MKGALINNPPVGGAGVEFAVILPQLLFQLSHNFYVFIVVVFKLIKILYLYVISTATRKNLQVTEEKTLYKGKLHLIILPFKTFILSQLLQLSYHCFTNCNYIILSQIKLFS